jgi:hypothetical protein
MMRGGGSSRARRGGAADEVERFDAGERMGVRDGSAFCAHLEET